MPLFNNLFLFIFLFMRKIIVIITVITLIISILATGLVVLFDTTATQTTTVSGE